jgi:hypothetical protein
MLRRTQSLGAQSWEAPSQPGVSRVAKQFLQGGPGETSITGAAARPGPKYHKTFKNRYAKLTLASA